MRIPSLIHELSARLRKFKDETRGSMTMELVIVIPILIWAYLATIVFFDAFRARTEAQSAALNVADVISRQTDVVRVDYLEGLNEVYDALTSRVRQTRLRISSVSFSEEAGDYVVLWSYGTRGLPPLRSLDQVVLDPEDFDEDGNYTGSGGGASSGGGSSASGATGEMYDDMLGAFANLPDTSFFNPGNMLPQDDLSQRIPQIEPGEALILVEAFTIWETPSLGVLGIPLLRNVRLSPVAVTRPRFSPFVRFELDNEMFPESPPELVSEPGPGEAPPEGSDPDSDPDSEPPSDVTTIIDTDFNDGDTTGWSSDTVTSTMARSFFGPFGRETRNNPVTYGVNLGAESSSARIEFDLFVIDSWDGYQDGHSRPEGEHLAILVNGSSIATEPFEYDWWDASPMMINDRRTVASRTEGRFTTTMTRIEHGYDIFGGSWNDEVWRVVIDIENPAQNFTLGFAAHLDEPIHNESFALFNFRVTAKHGSHGPAHFVPSQFSPGVNPLNRFRDYRGCPDARIAAQTHNVTRSDLWNGLEHRVRARGHGRLQDCPGFNSSFDGHVFASPSLIIDYDIGSWTPQQARFRIITEDGDRGRDCHSHILVQNPFGEWSISQRVGPGNANRNAILNMGPSHGGIYTIWVMNHQQTQCDVDIRFETY